MQEALACGLPVVCERGPRAPTKPPLSTSLGVDLAGLRPDVVERLTAAFIAALAEPTAGAAIRAAFAHERYSWEAGAARYVELMERLSSAPTTGVQASRAKREPKPATR